ncbi:single-stranded DNA-binding protein [Frigoribacterium sp. CFBP9030]|uniref:single-stranded DNA-binding protein n=1 Tax=Frigoribacterium sp. CFBP9030 TaxID=3096537 RepID=UPI002A6B254C|nr:single-stranded DNA-binding protein [Frigoribacterium sp. CFBP9030]MDY0891861.1 single-stranded DNA-binding protein [Frigoribacterium sp. CFBP9030]
MGNPNITINGRLSKDPEGRTANGKSVAEITVPQQRSKKLEGGGYENVGGTSWITATFWEGDADAVMASLSKGSEVIVTGQLATQEYRTREGEDRTKLVIEFPKVALVLKGGQAQRTPQGGGAVGAAPAEPWATAQPGGTGGDAWATPAAPAGGYNDETPF